MGSSPNNGRYEDASAGRYQASQPTQSRSFRILQMMTDTADDGKHSAVVPNDILFIFDAASLENEQIESGRLSRTSVGSNGSGSRLSGPPERKLHLTQEDRELMDMFRSQGTFFSNIWITTCNQISGRFNTISFSSLKLEVRR